MKFRPLHDRVVIRRIEGEEKTKGGIIIPDTVKEKPQEGEVIARGAWRGLGHLDAAIDECTKVRRLDFGLRQTRKSETIPARPKDCRPYAGGRPVSVELGEEEYARVSISIHGASGIRIDGQTIFYCLLSRPHAQCPGSGSLGRHGGSIQLG
jgi:hypothetical protein